MIKTWVFICIVFCSAFLFGQSETEFSPFIDTTFSGQAPAYRVSHQHRSRISGVWHTYLTQQLEGRDICNLHGSIHVSRDGALLAFNHNFIANAQALMTPAAMRFTDARAVIGLIGNELGVTVNSIAIDSLSSASRVTLMAPELSSETIVMQEVWFMKNKMLIPAWQIFLNTEDAWWDWRIDATTGETLEKINWVSSCQFDHEEIPHHQDHQDTHEHFVPTVLTNGYTVFPIGIESPIHGNRIVLTDPSDSLASPFGWHDTNGIPGPEFTKTSGNNVEAKEDIAGNNETAIGAFAEGGSNLEFNFPLNLTAAPSANQNASLTNLFFWNNVVHDVWYQYGFDEAAGNFQKNNYGRGGTGEDFVLADGLDGSGTNNANFGTPPDGQKPRMQMFLWNSILVTSPSAIKGTYKAARAQFGPVNYQVTEQLVLVNDGSADPTFACNALTNVAEVAGKIALIDRGTCEFSAKCLNAQNAGAIAVIVCNNVSGDPFAMPAGANGTSVTIPSVMVSTSAGNTLKAHLAAGVNVTLRGPELDGSLDNVIISHEYGHGISTRLTGGAANSSCLSNQEQMGEGWSDWFGLMLTMKSGHTGVLGRGIGTYVTTQDTSANGIRPYRYSTLMATNPQTYDFIKTSAVPHGVGSVWCSMLWEVTWALIAKYGYDPDLYHGSGGNNMAMALVIEALKLQPCTPGFVDGRDAILLADQVLYNGANKCLIWQAFAKRGLGLSAIQGSSHSVTDGTEAFDVPVDCNMLLFTNTPSSFYLAPGDTLHYDIKLKNLHTATIPGINIKDMLDDLLIPVSASNGAAINGQEVVYPAFSLNSGDSILYRITSKIAINQNVQADSFYEDVETGSRHFQSIINNTLLQGWTRSSNNPNGGSFSWFVPDHPSPSVANLTLAIPERLSKGSKLQFWHKFSTENNWDGGRVYISANGQNTWEDLGPFMTENWYNGYLNNISSQTAFSGNVQNYMRTTIDLSSFENKVVYIRFQMYSDLADGGQGWFIDDILLTNTQRSVWNVATQTNIPQYNSNANVKTPTALLPCQRVYVSGDSGQGSLRKAISCANIGDTISVIEDILNDTITLTSLSLTLDKNITLKNDLNQPIYIKSLHNDEVFIITNGAIINMVQPNISKVNPSGKPVIQKISGDLNLRGGKISQSPLSSGVPIQNSGGALNIEELVILKKQ